MIIHFAHSRHRFTSNEAVEFRDIDGAVPGEGTVIDIIQRRTGATWSGQLTIDTDFDPWKGLEVIGLDSQAFAVVESIE